MMKQSSTSKGPISLSCSFARRVHSQHSDVAARFRPGLWLREVLGRIEIVAVIALGSLEIESEGARSFFLALDFTVWFRLTQSHCMVSACVSYEFFWVRDIAILFRAR